MSYSTSRKTEETRRNATNQLQSGADTGFMKGGALYIKRCRRQCIEACSADQSAQSAEKVFHLHFSLLRMGSHGTFALCTASSRCTRIAGPRAAMSFFLAQILLTNVIRTYTEVVVSFPSRSVSGNARYCELRRPGQELQRSGSKLVRRKIK